MSDKTFAEFSETITVAIPNIGDKLVEFSESKKRNHALIVEVAAIHAGLTANYNYYGAKELERALESWVAPYPKPIILNHDISVDPVGRVMAAKMDVEKDGTAFTRLQVAITDPSAVEKIASKRYLTGSVGGKSEAALCSVCGKDWAEATMFGPVPCKHVRGRTYKGQLAYLERMNLSFKEYSFVNAPADSRSMVLAPEDEAPDGPEETDGWITAAKFFDLNMDKEEVFEYTESEYRDLLKGMRKKESAPLYLSLKGAFLSSLAVAEAEDMHDDKETSAVSETDVQDVEDVLAVTEELSDDLVELHGSADEDATDEEATEDAEVDADATEDETEESEDADEQLEDGRADETVDESDEPTEDSDDEADVEEQSDADEDVEDTEEAEEEVEEANRPQGQEKAHTADIDSQFNTPTKDFPKPKATGDKTREEDESDEEVEEGDSETELETQETDGDLEPRVDESEQRIQALTEENARLKKALHRMLAERVVDTKIALGVESAEVRAELLEEHMSRSASSLADSLRDLATMKFRPSYATAPEMEENGVSINDDGSKIDGEEDTTEDEEADPITVAEQVFVDALMGRRKL